MLLEKHFLLIFRDIFEALWSFPSPSTTLGHISLPDSMSSRSSRQSKHPPSANSSSECPFLFCWRDPTPSQALIPLKNPGAPSPEETDLSWEVSFPGTRSGNGFSGCSLVGCKTVRIPRRRDAQG